MYLDLTQQEAEKVECVCCTQCTLFIQTPFFSSLPAWFSSCLRAKVFSTVLHMNMHQGIPLLASPSGASIPQCELWYQSFASLLSAGLGAGLLCSAVSASAALCSAQLLSWAAFRAAALAGLLQSFGGQGHGPHFISWPFFPSLLQATVSCCLCSAGSRYKYVRALYCSLAPFLYGDGPEQDENFTQFAPQH